jgi:hypothetical protein
LNAWHDDLEVGVSVDAAWLFALITVEATVGQDVVTMPMRMTGTATPKDGQWQLRQAHLSRRRGYPAAAWMARQTRSPLPGMSMCRTPRWLSASTTAFWIAGVRHLTARRGPGRRPGGPSP